MHQIGEPLAHENLARVLGKGATVLTANNRLARAIKYDFDRLKQQQGKTVWTRANVFPIEIWLQHLLAELKAKGLIDAFLPGTALQGLRWESLLAADRSNDGFLNIPAMAGVVQQAWSIAKTYEFPFSDYTSSLTREQKQFLRWAEKYQALSSANNLIDQATLLDYLLQNGRLDQCSLPDHVVLAGFYELTPLQSRLINDLNLRSIKIQCLQKVQPAGALHYRLSPRDDQAELEMAAAWARKTLEMHPGIRLAIVVPDLDARKTELEYQLRQTFYPGMSPDQVRQIGYPWNFSLGVPLNALPIVETVTLLLKLKETSLESNELTRLLLSPYLAKGESERHHRSAIDVREVVRRRMTSSLDDVRVHVLTARTPGLNKALKAFAKVNISGDHKLSYWSAVFAQLLDAAGWPGERTLNSHEYQQVENLRDAVSELAQMDKMAEVMNYSQARMLLQKSLTKTPFQAMTRNVPIQILGLLEVTGLSFDAAWICEMDNDRWPLTGMANPFLPLRWQREVGAPHACADRELAFAHFLIDELNGLGKEVIYSHVAMRDENQLEAAKAIDHLPSLDFPRLKGESTEPLDTNSVVKLETVADFQGPGVQGGQKVKGGTGLLSAQAQCPFKAYATYRLHATDIERPTMGIDPRDRGNLIHELLEKFWQITSTHEALSRLTEEQIRFKVTALADELMQSENFLLKDYQRRLKQLERDRLIQVTVSWLEFEKQRQAFTIEAVEQARELEFEGLPIRMMIDRIDRIHHDNGMSSKAIIDYKSGLNHDPDNWMLDRPLEPQLPLYAMTESEDVSSISFALMSHDQQAFKGFAESEDLLPGVGLPSRADPQNPRKKIKLPWPEAIAFWENKLGLLATEIREGYAAVLPEKGACAYCKLNPFCRVDDKPEEEL